jgi:hypothetical protein
MPDIRCAVISNVITRTGIFSMRCIALLCLAVLLLPALAFARPADIDRSWASNGFHTTTGRTIDALGLDTQDRVLVAGRNADAIYLRRLQASGAVDKTFGNSGTLSLPTATAHRPVALAVTGDGSAYLALQKSTDGDGVSTFTLRRATASGSWDTSFAGSGSLTVPDSVLTDIFLDAQGRLYLIWNPVGFVARQWQVTRYLADGSLDASYGSSGSATGDGWVQTAAQVSGEALLLDYYQQTFDGVNLQTDWFQARIDGDGTVGTPLDLYEETAPAATIYADRFSVPGAPGDDAQMLAFVTTAPTIETLPVQGLAYPDGYLLHFGDTIGLWKHLLGGFPDISWNNRNNGGPFADPSTSGPYVDNGKGHSPGLVDAQGRVLLAVNTHDAVAGDFDAQAPGKLLRVKGSRPDTTPPLWRALRAY